jgi:NTE family protein
VGVLKQLEKLGIRADVTYGTSVGALNATGYAYVGVRGIEKVWLNIRSKRDILKFQWGTLLLKTKGVYSTAPLRKLVDGIVTDNPQYAMPHVCFTNLETGAIEYKSPLRPLEGSLSFVDAVIASASMPMAMNPVKNVYVDGGVREVTPLKRAIMDGVDEIYVLLCSPYRKNLAAEKDMNNWLCYGYRSFSLAMHEIFLNDIIKCMYYNSRSDKKIIGMHIYAPKEEFVSTLDFNPKKIRQGILLGERAEEVIEPLRLI